MAKSGNKKETNTTGLGASEKVAREVFVIGIGASAGGLQAFEELFSQVPNDSVAYVIVQHLSSQHISLLADMVARKTILEVVEARNNMPVETNKVYVIPNNKELTIQDNYLQLNDKSSSNRAQTVDTFFKSLAVDKGERAVGIILSGTGRDGSEGVEAMKAAGGLVIVQDPDTAKFDEMPRNAIKTGCADFVLAPEQMPAEVFNYVKVTPLVTHVNELINQESEPSLNLILDMVHDRTGIDFTNYKRPTIIRRISRRMAITNVSTVVDYLDYLNLHPEEVETLSKEFLIGVTKFFRDQEAYEVLAERVIPQLIDSKKKGDQLRIWVAGSSTGEEAYSIAIHVREYMDKIRKELEVKIFASDIDREALDFAGKGLYPLSKLSEVSEERIHDFFIKEEGKFRVCQRVRRMVIFAPHNVINDPPFSRVDLVSCRNMLIYLNPLLQRKVIEKFHYSLQVGGFLFLGSSESIGDLKNFKEVNKKWKIYRNVEQARSLGIESFTNKGLNKKNNTNNLPGYTRDLNSKQLVQHAYMELLNETVLEEYGYAAIYVDENYDILHGTGRFKNYLDLPENNFTFNLLKLVSPDLSVSLGSLLRKAIRDKEKVAVQGIKVREGSTLRYINVVVKPYLTEKNVYQRFLLVLFSDDQPRTPLEAEHVVLFNDNNNENRAQELELELQHTKEDLQAVVEELETANEELQSTNEELLSSNEELQSTNEELQSLNEELHTINAEHQYKIKALVELDDDLNNYFRSTDIGQIFVDRQLIIRKFTPAATTLVNVIEGDIGRSIYQISNNLRYDHIIEDIRSVIASTKIIEKEVQDKRGVWYQMRVLPYITQERKIDGAIVIFVQIHELKNLHLLHAGILDSSPNAIMALKSIRNKANTLVDFELTVLNRNAHNLIGVPEAGLIGKSLWREYPSLLENGLFEQLTQVVEKGNSFSEEQLMQHEGQEFWLHIVAVKFDDGLVLTLQNITDRKRYEQALKEQREEIRRSSERFQTLLGAMPHITWTNKANRENETFNETWYNYTGLTEDESKGWGWKKAYHPDDLAVIMPDYMECLQTGREQIVQARILRKSTNQYRWHIIKDVPILNDKGEVMFWVGTATDIQDQKEADERNIRLRLSQQREILKAILKAQEAERDRISEALHNGLGQILYATKLNLANLQPVDDKQKEVKRQVDELLKESISVTRHISQELTPTVLKDFGLKTAVEEIITRFNSSNLSITSTFTGLSDQRLESTTELSFYRIIQELLNNVVKHSKATKASVDFNLDNNKISLRVKDNGIGINKADFNKIKGMGLSSIQNRVNLLDGKMEIDAAKGKGTSFTITCTLDGHEE